MDETAEVMNVFASPENLRGEDINAECQPKISVVVCTHNRSRLLPTSLGSLVEQSLDATEFEVVVVDNLSSDDTFAVVEKFSKRYSSIRYCFESRLGLSHARNRGWREARGEYVAYTDDDCKLPRRWLEVATEIIGAISPCVFGGPYFAFYGSSKPRWYKDSYGSRGHGDRPLNLKPDQFLSGGNIFFRRSLLEAMGGFDPDFGMSGNALGYGEETVLQERIRSQLGDDVIYYDPKLYVYHLVRPNKMSMKWLIRRRFVGGRYCYRIKKNDKSSGGSKNKIISQSLKIMLLMVLDFPKSLIRDRHNHKYLENYFYEVSLNRMRMLGELYEQCHQLSRCSPKSPEMKLDLN